MSCGKWPRARSPTWSGWRKCSVFGGASRTADRAKRLTRSKITLTGRAANHDDPQVRHASRNRRIACVAEHRGMPQFRNSDDKIGPAVAGPPALQFATCDTTGAAPKQFPLVRQAMEKGIMIKDFNVSEKGYGSYWLLGILRWVMVLIFVSFGIQKFTPQSAQGIALYISNSPFVSWLSIFGIRGEAYLLGIIELTTAAILAAGAF